MKRLGTALMAVAIVVALAAVPIGAAAAFAADDDESESTADSSNNSVAPGEQFAGVIGVQNAEIEGEVADRTFGIQLANAQTDETKADVVADRLAEIEERLEEHDAELAELDEAREAGELTEGQYRAQVAAIAAENANTERAAERADATASGLPEAILEERGINVAAIQELQANASELGGPETAEIAQSIAGANVGHPVGDDWEPGPPEGVPGGGGPADETDDQSDDGEPAGAENADDQNAGPTSDE